MDRDTHVDYITYIQPSIPLHSVHPHFPKTDQFQFLA